MSILLAFPSFFEEVEEEVIKLVDCSLKKNRSANSNLSYSLEVVCGDK